MPSAEFAALIAEGGAEVRCTEPGCAWAAGPGPAFEMAAEVEAHMIGVHGMTVEEASQAQTTVSVHVWRCQRCDVNYREERDLSALSRADNTTRICDRCGTDEALEQASTGRVTPVSEWPVSQRRPEGPHGFQSPDWRDQRSERSHRPNPAPTPKELPDLRVHLLERWVDGGVFDRYSGSQEAAWERRALRNASLWWVKDEMVDLTTAAAPTIPLEVKAGEIDLPADQPYGLAVLAKPWTGGLDAEDPDNQVTVDAIVWGPAAVAGVPVLTVSFYRYLDFAGGLSPIELEAATASGAIHEAKQERFGGKDFRLYGGAWMWMGRTDWPLDAPVEDFTAIPRHPRDSLRRQESMIEDRRWFAALCVLVNHRLSEQEMVYAARQTRRRAERAGVEAEAAVSTVRLIRLRQARHEHPDDDEPGEGKRVEWTHRWMVGSHMAWRRCGPKRTQRRLVFVAPYVKGPADRPLVIKDNVRVWVK